MSETRERLLEVTARIFAEAGYHGTTTRRIAQEAEINEVTLFRHFGTKEALIQEALRLRGVRNRPMLDQNAADPAEELYRWSVALFFHFYGHRNLIRRLMADMVERPEIAPTFCEDSSEEFVQLARYLERLKREGAAAPDLHPESASGMLVGALLSNALWRDHVGETPPPEENVRLYVDFFLRASGIRTKGASA
jgi:AcrR family transcriptional regulator